MYSLRFMSVTLGYLLALVLSFSSAQPSSTWSTAISPVLKLSEIAYPYSRQDFPDYVDSNFLNRVDNTPAHNPIDDRIATLGRVLFYDTKLSANNSVSCSSCHKQASGFSDTNQFSVGFEGELTNRNSMGLANSRFYSNGHFFWDERASSLEEQVLMPIEDEIEMGMNLAELPTKLAATSYYPTLFEWAFGDAAISSERVSLALSQFVRSLVSYETKYDLGLAMTGNANADFPNFTAAENAGKDLFMSRRTDCANCHMEVLGNQNNLFFFMDQPRNNGLDAGNNADNGVADITGRNQDSGEFKVPSLRNIALTAPYMHDGRFASLEDVIDFYSSGIQPHPNLDNRLTRRGGRPVRMNFSQQEASNLIAFLNTLTDEAMLSNEAFSNPFVHNEAESTATN